MNVYEAWCRETSADPDEWSVHTPALGQCAVTALVVQDICGGRLIRGETAVDGVVVGSHYWNLLSPGVEVDLTRQQFAFNVAVINPDFREREYLLSHPETARRYQLLRQRVLGELTCTDPNCEGVGTTHNGPCNLNDEDDPCYLDPECEHPRHDPSSHPCGKRVPEESAL